MKALITADEIVACRPCWGADRVRAAVGSGVMPSQIASAADLSIEERRWVLTRVCARRDLRTLVAWAAGCAQDVARRIDDADTLDAVLCAISTAAAWTAGAATYEDCIDAAYAAYSAAFAVYAASAAYTDAAYAAAYASSAAAASSASSTSAAATYAAYAADSAAYAYAAYASASAADSAAYAYAATAAAARHLLDLATAMEAQ